MINRRGLILAGVSLVLPPGLAAGQDSDPRSVVVRAFYDVLLATMKDGPALGFDGRFERLAPAIRDAFDTGSMVERAVGASWDTLDLAQRDSARAEFERYMIASYAARFREFKGQAFEVLEVREAAGKPIVLTRLVKSDGEPVSLGYVMREIDGAWKIADVYYSGTISEVARLRSDFSSTLMSGGIEALNAALEERIRLLREGT